MKKVRQKTPQPIPKPPAPLADHFQTFGMDELRSHYPGLSRREIQSLFREAGFYSPRNGKPFLVHRSHVEKIDAALAELAAQGPLDI